MNKEQNVNYTYNIIKKILKSLEKKKDNTRKIGRIN